MSRRTYQPSRANTATPAQTGVLQRGAMQPANHLIDVSSVVQEVLGSPGERLDPETRDYMESSFSQNFSHLPVRSVQAARPPARLSVSRRGDPQERQAEQFSAAFNWDAGAASPALSMQASPVDFRQVRVHAGAQAARSAQGLNADAYTVGNHIVFDSGRYNPRSTQGRGLLAHELVHTLQQSAAGPALNRQESGSSFGDLLPSGEAVTEAGLGLMKEIGGMIPEEWLQQYASGFCQPFASDWEANTVWYTLLTVFIPAITAKFGSEVGGLWESYMRRKPGDSLKPQRFSSLSSSVVQGFITSATTKERQDQLVKRVVQALPKVCPSLPANAWAPVPVSSLLPAKELQSTGSGGNTDSDINFNQFLEIPGNIAGGVGDSDAGDDFREVSGNVLFYRTVDSTGLTTGVRMKTDFSFYVFDAVDFCPLGTGDPGASIEQVLTVPLSRLEAHGFAFDAPFEVIYKGTAVESTLDQPLVDKCWPKQPVKKEEPKPQPEGQAAPAKERKGLSQLGSTLLGAAAGAVTGAVIGGILGGGVGALVGAGLGALVGGVAGYILGAQKRHDPLDDMSTFQSPGNSGWHGAAFGCYRNNCTRKHEGWDIRAPVGSLVYAVEAGTISHHENQGGYGHYLKLSSEDEPSRKYLFGHLSDRKAAGDYRPGDVIGKTGTSGNASANRPHLHVEVEINDNPVDPADYFSEPSNVVEAAGTSAKPINKDEAPTCTPCSM